MDVAFTDFDVVALKIRNPDTRKYFLEATKCYKIGALRSSISATWVAVVYDLIGKFRELTSLDDKAAKKFVDDWQKSVDANNTKRLLELERDIVDYATKNVQLLNGIANEHLSRLRQDRHLCAHPAFSSEADLFEPTPELVRAHLVHAVSYVFSVEPLQGKAIIERFSNDITSLGFPNGEDDIKHYVRSRYLERMRENNVLNFIIVLAKSIIKGVPTDWNPLVEQKVLPSLRAAQEFQPEIWADARPKIIQLLNENDPDTRQRYTSFIGEFPEFWSEIQDDVKVTIQAVLEGLDPSDQTSFKTLRAGKVPDLEPVAITVTSNLRGKDIIEAVKYFPHEVLVNKAVEKFCASTNFRSAENNVTDYLIPIAHLLQPHQLLRILDGIHENGQIGHAHKVPENLALLFAEIPESVLPETADIERVTREIYEDSDHVFGRFSNLWGILGKLRGVYEPPEDNVE